MIKTLIHHIDGASVVMQSADAEMPDSWHVLTASSAILLTSLIDSQKKVEQFFAITQKLHDEWKKPSHFKFPYRAVSCQVCSPITDWDQIFAQHLWITWLHYANGLSAQCAHYNLPTEHFYAPKEQAHVSEFYLKAVSKLPELQNIDAWEMYCYWMNEEIEVILEKIPLEFMDTYTLEARLKDFVHEIHSSLLRNLELDIQSDILKIGSMSNLIKFPVSEKEDIVVLEKSLVKARHEALPGLRVQYETLGEIVRVVEIIESSHPEFISLKYKASILKEWMDGQIGVTGVPTISWAKQILLMQLLHEELGIVTVVNSNSGHDRTCLAF